jgi:ATP adenylyltransferase
MSKKKKSSLGRSSSKNSKKNFIQIESQQWPLERDVLFRPERLKYVRKLLPQKGCVFCEAAKKENSFDSLCVLKTEHSMVVLNKFPYNPGHLLVLPLEHCGELLKLSDAQYTDLHLTLRKAFKALQEVFSPEGVNIGLNHGKVAGAGIPEHLHYHLVPRWFGDLNFFPLIAQTKVVVMNLEESYDRLKGYFSKK